MPTTKAIVRQISAAWLCPLTTNSAGEVTGKGTEIPFDYIQDAGPTWPVPDGAADTEFVEVTAANGVVVQYPKVTTTLDGVTGTEKTSGSGGSAHKLKFTLLEWGKTLAGSIPALQGKLVLCCIPIGENVDSSENGWYYLLGKFSSEISYDAKGEEVVAVSIEVTGSSVTATSAGDTALAWAPGEITPVGEDDGVTPTPLTSSQLTALKSGSIVVM